MGTIVHLGEMPAPHAAPMPSTFTNLDYHIVFSTKDREPTIATDGAYSSTNTWAASSKAEDLRCWYPSGIRSSVSQFW